jgi:hypothetical protein
MSAAVLVVVAACAPVDQGGAANQSFGALPPGPVAVAPLAAAPEGTVPDGVILAQPTPAPAGLESREPDLCHAIDYVPYLSQPGTVIATLGITRPYRVVQWRGIEPQDYDAGRIVFRLDAAGNIFNIDCG